MKEQIKEKLLSIISIAQVDDMNKHIDDIYKIMFADLKQSIEDRIKENKKEYDNYKYQSDIDSAIRCNRCDRENIFLQSLLTKLQ